MTSSPPIRMRPLGVGPNPAIARSSVDLPEPEGPRKVKSSPSRMARSMPLRTSVVPKESDRFSMVTAALWAALRDSLTVISLTLLAPRRRRVPARAGRAL